MIEFSRLTSRLLVIFHAIYYELVFSPETVNLHYHRLKNILWMIINVAKQLPITWNFFKLLYINVITAQSKWNLKQGLRMKPARLIYAALGVGADHHQIFWKLDDNVNATFAHVLLKYFPWSSWTLTDGYAELLSYFVSPLRRLVRFG